MRLRGGGGPELIAHRQRPEDETECSMAIGTGGLIRQGFVKDDCPENWEEQCIRVLRFHIIDPASFEAETGLELDEKSQGGAGRPEAFVQTARAELVQSPETINIPSYAMLDNERRVRGEGLRSRGTAAPATDEDGETQPGEEPRHKSRRKRAWESLWCWR